jgi:hypothetical protein
VEIWIQELFTTLTCGMMRARYAASICSDASFSH